MTKINFKHTKVKSEVKSDSVTNYKKISVINLDWHNVLFQKLPSPVSLSFFLKHWMLVFRVVIIIPVCDCVCITLTCLGQSEDVQDS